MEQLPDLVSLYTAELGAIYLALRHGVGSTRITFIICVDLMSCVQPIGTFSIKIPLVFRILQVTETCWYSGQWTTREGCQRCFKSSEDQHPVTVHRLPTYHRTMCKKVVVRYLVTANRKQTACSAAYFGMLDVGPIGKRRREEMVFCGLWVGHRSSPIVISWLEKNHQIVFPARNT